MKKFLSLILALTLLVLCLASCAGDGSGGGDTEHVHKYADATCKTAKKCSCGLTDGQPLNTHTFDKGVCTVCEKELIDEVGSLAIDHDNSAAKKGFSVGTESGYINDTDIVHVTATVTADGDTEDVWLAASITITQDAIVSGTYEWEFKRNTYNEEADRYENETMKGTFIAPVLSSSSDLTVTEIKNFSDSDATSLKGTAFEMLEDAIKDLIAPVLVESESNITVADLGFENFTDK